MVNVMMSGVVCIDEVRSEMYTLFIPAPPGLLRPFHTLVWSSHAVKTMSPFFYGSGI